MGRHVITSVVVAVYLFLVEFLFHAVILNDQYEGVARGRLKRRRFSQQNRSAGRSFPWARYLWA